MFERHVSEGYCFCFGQNYRKLFFHKFGPVNSKNLISDAKKDSFGVDADVLLSNNSDVTSEVKMEIYLDVSYIHRKYGSKPCCEFAGIITITTQ